MLRFAITGNIASGKSYVLKRLSRHFKTVDCDKIVHSLYKNRKIQKKLLKEFGTYDRRKLSFVFKDKKKRKILEKIFHQHVLKAIKKAFRDKRDTRAIFIEVPLLFEAGFQKYFDFIILVYSTKRQQLERLIKKRYSMKEALLRINSLPIKEKLKKADFIIKNTKDFKFLDRQIDNIIEFVYSYEKSSLPRCF